MCKKYCHFPLNRLFIHDETLELKLTLEYQNVKIFAVQSIFCRLAMLMMMNVKFDRKQSVIVATGLVTVMSFGLRVVNQCYRIIESVCTFRTRVVLVLKILYLFTFLNFGIRLGISRHPSFLSLLTRDVTRKICFF